MVALVLTGTFMIVEVVGGIISGSLALLADAGHMLTDTMALALAAMAFHVSKRPPDGNLTFGYQRFQILAAFVNGLSLLAVVGWILFEAIRRFISPNEILGETMLVVAAAGLVVNLISFAVLHSGDQDNLNIRGAALHVAGDLLGSVAAIVAALVIIYTGCWMLIDPILSVAVAALILKSAWSLVKRSAHILLEGAPEWLDVQMMQDRIVAGVPAVSEIHHVHIWGLTPQELMLTMHMCVVDNAIQADVIRDAKRFLKDEYGIGHATIEVDVDGCSDH